MIEIESDWKKHAAQVYSDQDVEKAFLDQAYMFVQNKATPLMQDPYRLGFEIVYKNDANSKMVGIFAFKVGEELIYAPAFFVNGAIKGTDLLYRHKNKTFVPLTNDWATYLVGTQQTKSGKSIDKGQRSSDGLDVKKLIMPPDYASGSVTKSASYNVFAKTNEWLPDIDSVYEEIKEAASEGDPRSWQERNEASVNKNIIPKLMAMLEEHGGVNMADGTASIEQLQNELGEGYSVGPSDQIDGHILIKALQDQQAEGEAKNKKLLNNIGDKADVSAEDIAVSKSAGAILKSLITDVGKDAVDRVTDLMQKDATFAQNILTHVGLNNVLVEEIKQAKGRCWDGYEPVPGKEPYSDDSCRPVGSKKKKKTEKKAGNGLTVHMGFLNSNVKEASEKLAANGFLFEDNRAETDLVYSVFEEQDTEYSGVSEAGIHKVLKKDGTTAKCLVVPNNGKSIVSSYWEDDEDAMDSHQRFEGSRGYGSPSPRYTVVDLSDNSNCCVDSKKIITADNEAVKESGDDDLDQFEDTPTPGNYYMLLDLTKGVNGSTISSSFYVKSSVASGNGVNKYRIDWSSDSYQDDENLPTLTINPDYESNNYKDKVFKKGDIAFVKVDNKKEVDLASPADLHKLIMKGGVKSAAIHRTELGFVTKSGSNATSEQSKFSTTCYLMKYGGFTEQLAGELIDKAQEKGVIKFYMPKQAHNLSFGEDPEEYFTEDMDDVFGIAQNSPQSVQLIADSAEPDMPDNPSIGDSIKFDNASELEGKGPNDLAALAEQLGSPSLFEHGVVGSLANTYDSSMLIDKYFPDLEKALDRLGRMVFLFYWKPEDFSHLYGADDQSSLESMLVSNFKQFGELVLELLKKISSFTESAGRTY